MVENDFIPAKFSVLDPYLTNLIVENLRGKKVKIFDFGCGDGNILLKLPTEYQITAYDIDDKDLNILNHKIIENNCFNIKIIDEKSFHSNKEQIYNKYDLVLCSLVLCLYQDDNTINEILSNLYNLLKEKGILLIVICNPLFIHEIVTETVVKHLPKNWRYDKIFSYEKTVKQTNRNRSDVHRPLKSYETLISKANLLIESILQVPPLYNKEKFISDYLIFICKKNVDFND